MHMGAGKQSQRDIVFPSLHPDAGQTGFDRFPANMEKRIFMTPMQGKIRPDRFPVNMRKRILHICFQWHRNQKESDVILKD